MKNKNTRLHCKYVLGVCICLIISSVVNAQSLPPDLQRLRKQFVNQVMEPPVNNQTIEKLLQTFQADSTWTGIDYTNLSREAFEHRRHLANLEQLCRAYRRKGSKYRGNKQVKQVIDKALAFWIKNDFLSENWYSNEIGTPESFSRILLIMDESLTPQQVEGILPIAGRAHINAWGARPSGDRIKIAGIQAKVAFFNYDPETIEMLFGVIQSEIKFSSGVGLKRDYSFQHRGDKVNNTLHYGLNYATTFAEWADMLAGTSFALSEESINMLIDFYLDGICKQMVYGRMRDMGILNRDISRRGETNLFSSKVPRQLIRASKYRREELDNIVRARESTSFKKESFAYHYWLSDHFVFQSPLYYSSVRMFSTRNHNMEEPYNGEGFYNHFRGDGANHISVTGEEYKDIAPFFEWRKVPGATVLNGDKMPPEKELQKQGFTSFAGAVTDGTYGAAGFDFISPHEPLRAKKAWFFFEEGYICLGAGITTSQNVAASTTLNQCLLNGPVIVKSTGNPEQLIADTEKTASCRWVIHDKIGYYFPDSSTVTLSNRKRSGRFSDISRQAHASKELLEQEIFKLYINHKKPTRHASYAYMVLADMNPDKLEKWTEKNSWQILANTPALQAVYATDKETGYGVFYSAGKIQLGQQIIEVDHPGMILVQYDGKQIKSITVSDPTHQLSRFHLSVSQLLRTKDDCRIEWNKEKNTSILTINLPEGEYKGKSVTIHF